MSAAGCGAGKGRGWLSGGLLKEVGRLGASSRGVGTGGPLGRRFACSEWENPNPRQGLWRLNPDCPRVLGGRQEVTKVRGSERED